MVSHKDPHHYVTAAGLSSITYFVMGHFNPEVVVVSLAYAFCETVLTHHANETHGVDESGWKRKWFRNKRPQSPRKFK